MSEQPQSAGRAKSQPSLVAFLLVPAGYDDIGILLHQRLGNLEAHACSFGKTSSASHIKQQFPEISAHQRCSSAIADTHTHLMLSL